MNWPDLRKDAGSWWQWLVGRRIWVQVMLWALVVALLGELKLQLFANSPFRITLGPAGLGVALLFFPHLPILRTGAAAGFAIVLLRTATGLVAGGHLAMPDLLYALPAVADGFWPAGVYYVSYSVWLYLLRARDYARARPLMLFAGIAVADTLSNVLELALRPDPVTFYALKVFVLVALGRASLVAGLYLTMKSQEAEWQHARERAEYRRLLLFVTGLQAEIFFLSKSSTEIEHIMVRAHTLHRSLRGESELAALALGVAKDVHEVKKDYQRILAGLQRLLKIRSLEPDMAMTDVVGLVLDANKGYADQMNKAIDFVSTVRDDFRTSVYTVWVSVLNNVVTNAVEACGQQGRIEVEAGLEGNRYVVRVSDTGVGIPQADWELIFSPGYSTKSDPVTGEFSTGLGLAHAAGLMASMGGDIKVERSSPQGTVFRLSRPFDAAQ